MLKTESDKAIIQDLKDRWEHRLTDWEKKFITSLGTQATLSVKQRERLDRIYHEALSRLDRDEEEEEE